MYCINMMNRLLTFLLPLLFPILSTEVKGQNADAPLEFDLTNPGMFAGTDFGRFFQRLYINQDYDRMLIFTSKKSRDKFGDNRLLEYYRKMEFGYPLNIKSKYIQGDTIWLNYLTTIKATRKVVKLPISVEGDTVRVIIQSIDCKYLLFD
jgi:hypothetical protein